MVPIKYNVRNLKVRWVNTLMTILGTGLIVWSSCALFSLVEGLQHSLNVSGDPLDLIVLRKGSSSETVSGLDSDKADKILNLDGIARDQDGKPLAAGELLHIPVMERVSGGRANLIFRGIGPASRKLRPDFQIVQGRDLEAGKGEAIVSRTMTRRFKGAGLGETLQVGPKESYRVVGIFTAGGSAAESEVWVDIADLKQNTRREGFVSTVQLRAASAEARDSLRRTIETDPQFMLAALPEPEFFATQSRTALFYKVAGYVIALFLSVGAMFAAANTMFAAVSSRTREIGTMRALGFSRFSILISFLGESVLLCTLGGIVGVLATLPLTFLTFGTNNIDTFAEISVGFRFGPLVLIVAAAMTLAMGVIGGLFPAIRAVRLDVISSLREL
ncbi:ABC transporter permease [Tundrisphaera lichenicola]|uniref:ABC transporter permease n=1 Tax=Tundrisphaera lichenicola TaxID=2029860 RepID=UPI003EBF55F9